jgi:hypothetical protein
MTGHPPMAVRARRSWTLPSRLEPPPAGGGSLFRSVATRVQGPGFLHHDDPAVPTAPGGTLEV